MTGADSADASREADFGPVQRWEWIAVIVATIIGGILRLWNIDGHPPGLWYDEAIIGLGVLDIIREPGLPIFFMIQGHPEEPLFYYLNVPAFLLFGAGGVPLRATSAVIGTLTIPAVWWCARQLFGARVAFWTLVFFTPMRWHVHFSRLSFRTLLAPLFAALAAGCFARAWRTQRPRDWALFGTSLGGGLYTYLSMRLFVVIAGVWCLAALFRRDDTIRMNKRIARVGIAAGIGLLVFLPLGIDFIRNPEHFGTRQAEVTEQMSAERLMVQARDVALMGILRGDHVEKHNISGPPKFNQAYLFGIDVADAEAAWIDARRNGTAPDVHGTGLPVFDVITGLVFYLGFGLLVLRLLRRDIAAGVVLSWLVLGSLASVLSFGAPNMLRLLYLTPAVAICIALAVVAALRRAGDGRARHAALIGAVLFGFWFAGGETWRFFALYPQNPRVWWGFNTAFTDVGRHLKSLADTEADPVIVPAFLADTPTFRLETDSVPHIFTDAETIPEGAATLRVLRTYPPFPPLRLDAPGGEVLATFETPAGDTWAELVRVPAPISTTESMP